MSKRPRLDPQVEVPTVVASTGYLAWCQQHSPQWLKMATVQLRSRDGVVLPAHRDILGAVSLVRRAAGRCRQCLFQLAGSELR